MAEDDHVDDDRKPIGDWWLVRSDFESSLVSLMTIAMAVGGNDDHLDTDYEGFDGLMRVSVRDAAQARAREARERRQ